MATKLNITDLKTPLCLSVRDQRCLHTLTGRAPETKMCAHNHECGRCPYDQMLDEIDHPVPTTERPDRMTVRAA